ncbi:hypothetical protein [Natronorubrum sp. DTA7]|uniref:hypothetical protein n=1 Tax=Natronorubrum sp. DTA7 TaxID=3447016 RepID=UPI003F847632
MVVDDLHPVDGEILDRITIKQLESAIGNLEVYCDIMAARGRDVGPYYPDEGYAVSRLQYELKEVKKSHEIRSDSDQDYDTSDLMHEILERDQRDRDGQ